MEIKKEIPVEYFIDPVTKEELKFCFSAIFNCWYLCNPSYCYYNREYWNFNNPKYFNNIKIDIWKQLQKNGEVSYIKDPRNNLCIGKRKDAIQFMKFCNFKGIILDIGCGPQKIPTYMKYNKNKDVFFIGIDPLPGEQPRDFSFVKGFGEYLPFRNNLFDQVLFVTSLDHVLDIDMVFSETKRVLKSEGIINIWLTEKSENNKVEKKSYKWYDKLKKPDEADDKFHYKKMIFKDIKDISNKYGLEIIDMENIEISKYKKEVFYKLKK